MGNIRRAYFDKDREYLEKLYKEILPDIKSCCDELGREHIRAWRAENKVFGSEVIEARYTVMSQRISYAIDRIGDLLSGKTDRIEELEYEYIDDPSILGADMYKMLCSTSVICV